MRLNDILLAPSITKNLLSVSRFCADNSVSIRFDESNVYLKDLETKQPEVIIGEVMDGLYQIHLNKNKVSEVNHCSTVDLATWHRRLGHACESAVRKIVADHGLSSTFKKIHCEACTLSKHYRLPYTSSHQKSLFPLDLLYADVWGPRV